MVVGGYLEPSDEQQIEKKANVNYLGWLNEPNIEVHRKLFKKCQKSYVFTCVTYNLT